ncbi:MULTISPECIES: hypothetical protein [unclassified Caballeronia]|uniref:hypothetical protein n=1 Tax=unclassified Caballeronia TaxID=2646786 RepID=UPI002862371C|nr:MULTISPECIES: hypothetical protein [unclassified Caballeronia]MDR5777401.1 hypothetical protein [Caballeronia sp. LZ002]MDR5852855.1 hypothetical protein [Caballeronia sp. LZ003]
MEALSPQALQVVSERWSVLLNVLDRHPGRYPEQLYGDVIALIAQTERLLDADYFENEVLQIASRLAHEGSLKMALFRLHEIIEARRENLWRAAHVQ